MNYSILIVDDEELIANGIAQMTEWSKINCCVKAVAYNGIDAKNLIIKLEPHIVICDIVMPGITGLELAKYCSQNYSLIKFIILTAYSDFEYAQKAVKHGVYDYILKPIETKDLLNTVKRAIVDIEKISEDKLTLAQLKNKVEQSTSVISASLMLDVAKHGVTAFMRDNSILYDEKSIVPSFIICVKFYNILKNQEESIKINIQKIYADSFTDNGYNIIRVRDSDILVFLCQIPFGLDSNTVRKRLINLCFETNKLISLKFGVVCSCVISSVYKNFEELHNEYTICSLYTQKTFFCSIPTVIDTVNYKYKDEQSDVDLEHLISQINNGDLNGANISYITIGNKLITEQNEYLALHIMREIYRKTTNISTKLGMLNKPSLQSIYVVENFEQMFKDIKKYLMSVCEYAYLNKSMHGKLKILILENYMDSSFDLAKAAEAIGVNSSYFSRLFKKEIGENFLPYVINIRIEKAKQLLKTTDYRSNEIAELTGFSNERYFAKVFKKQCGCTPKQYKLSNKEQ